MKARHSTTAKMNYNISNLTGKVRKVKSKVREVDTDTETSSNSSSDDELRASLDYPSFS